MESGAGAAAAAAPGSISPGSIPSETPVKPPRPGASAGAAAGASARVSAGVGHEAAWARVADLPCDVAVLLPAPGLRVRDLLGLAPGFLVRTTAPVSADVPLQVNGQVIAWCEFEVVRERLGVRLTELA